MDVVRVCFFWYRICLATVNTFNEIKRTLLGNISGPKSVLLHINKQTRFRVTRTIITAGTVTEIIPRYAKFGEMSYKHPPTNVKIATLKLIANAAYIPCAVGIRWLGSLSEMNRMKAKWATPNDKRGAIG